MLSNRSVSKLSTSLLLAVGVSTLTGCFNDDADLKLAQAPKAKETLNDGQKIRVFDATTGSDTDISRETLAAELYAQCQPGVSGSVCDQSLVNIRQGEMCVGRTQLALAKPQAAAVTVGRYVIKNLASADRARFALDAIPQLQRAASHIDREIRYLLSMPYGSTGYTPGCNPSYLTNPTYPNVVQFTSGLYSEIYHLVAEAFDVAIQEMVNIEDSGQVATATVPGWGAYREHFYPNGGIAAVRLNRRTAARLLAGGIHLSDTLVENSLCDAPKLTPDAKAALNVLRETAPSPAAVTDLNVSLETLLNADTGDSVKRRLSSTTGYTLTANVEQHFGLDTQAFRVARDYLRQEISVFQRSALPLPARQQRGGLPELYPRYAGTAGDPQPLTPAYYFAIARTPANLLFHQTAFDGNPDPPPLPTKDEFMPLADWIDAAIGNAADYIAHSSVIPETKRKQAIAPFSLLVASGERKGFVQVLRNDGFYIYGFAGPLRIVQGEEAMRCATTGTSEGGVCPTTIPGWQPMDGGPNWRAVGLPDGMFYLPMTNMPADRFYVLRAIKNTAAPGPGDYEVITGLDLQWTGQDSTEHYVALGTDWGPIASPAYTWFNAPVIPAVQRKVRDLLAPSRKSCGRNRFNCVFSDVDDRIPLEDELSDDGNGVESSWKHYLDLARDAAALADNLGADYVNSGLQSSQRTEEVELRTEEFKERASAATKELQELCGADIDLTTLRDKLADGSACTSSNATQCAFEIGAIAAALPADPNIQRIYRCLTSNSQDKAAFVSLGTKPLCLWKIGANDVCGSTPMPCTGTGVGTCPASPWLCWGGSANQTGVCKLPCTNDSQCPASMACTFPSDAGGQGFCEAGPGRCPVLKDEQRTCTQMFSTSNGQLSLPPGAGVVPTPTETLGYFDTPPDSSALQSERTGLGFLSRCQALAKSRTDHADRRNVIGADSFLNPWSLERFASRLNWEARYGGYSAIYDNSAPRWQTGNAFAGGGPQVSAWPCAQLPGATEGFFRKSYNCTNEVERASANYTMLKAVMGARLFAGMSGFKLESAPTDRRASYLKNWIPISETSPETLAYWADNLFPIRQSNFRPPEDYISGPILSYMVQGGCPGNAGPGRCRAWTRPSGDATALDQAIAATGIYFAPFAVFAAGTPGVNGAYSASTAIPVSRAAEDALKFLLNPQNTPNHEYWYGALTAPPDERSRGRANIGNWYLVGTRGTDGSVKEMNAKSEPSDRIVIGMEDLLNGLELMCHLSEQNTPKVDLSRPPVMSTVDDLQIAAEYVKELGRSIRRQASTQLLANMPRAAVDALRAESASGAYPQFGGAMGEAISSIRVGLLAVRDSALQIGNELDQISYDLRNVHGYLKQQAIQRNIEDLKFQAHAAEEMAACKSAVVGAAGLDFGAIGRAMSAAITCANSFTQIEFSEQIRDLQTENTTVASEIAISAFGASFATHATHMQSFSLKTLQGLDDLEKGLTRLETNAQLASRALSKALYLTSFHAEEEARLTHAIGNLYTQKQARYQRALQNAKRLAVLAKAAIEQRLGMSLSSMTADLPLVDAPANWENQVCSFSGLDYDKLGDPGSTSGTYSDGFIGDYVTKLGNVVESYRLASNFREGTDVAVVSLKNDVMNIRQLCDVPGSNLLYFASQLGRVGAPGWVQQGCASSGGELLPNCVNVHPLGKSPSRFLTDVDAYELIFGTGALGADTGLVQQVNLPEGKYRFSWYTSASDGEPSVLSGQVRGYDGTRVDVPLVLGSSTADWNRKAIEFTIVSPRTVTVGFFNQNGSGATPKVLVAAPMLERLPAVDGPRSLTPFNDTAESLLVQAPACEDVSGAEFRATGWRKDCVRLCADGFSSTCSSARSKAYCYREAKFDINQRDIQLGRLMNYSGFARGNFNYRIDSIALNFVGTALRDCANQTVSTPCYSAGYVPYSLYHNGPFYVRNGEGDDFEARIFDGKIESARGLALERYLTNPLGETDRSLLQDYVRTELQGRPLDGNFVIRVWDQDGVDFDAIQDVQILLKYRYWTRFN
ncbi:MAG: hypothetical protein ACOY0T_27990 [Myxococcota bacterium]